MSCPLQQIHPHILSWEIVDGRQPRFSVQYGVVALGNGNTVEIDADRAIYFFRRYGVFRKIASRIFFVFDVFRPDLDRLQRDPDARFPVRTIELAEGKEIRIEETSRYDPVSQVRMATWYFTWSDGQERVVELNVRMIFPQELLVLLEAAGMRLIDRFGDFERTPFASDSRSQVCICAKA